VNDLLAKGKNFLLTIAAVGIYKADARIGGSEWGLFMT
jgi:hypothetical protein